MVGGRRFLGKVLLPFLALVLAGGPGLVTTTMAAAAAGGDQAKAASINLQMSDLPSGTHWVSSPSAPGSAALKADARRGLACIKGSGKLGSAVSADPFGTIGHANGDATADVSSPMFGTKGFTGLPGANSEVVFVTSASQAVADLAAFANARVDACSLRLLEQASAAGGAGSAQGSAAVLSRPSFGAGNGGVHERYTLSGGLLPGKLYDDVYYYVEGRAEVALSFVNLGSPFSPKWIDAILAKVMARAKAVAG